VITPAPTTQVAVVESLESLDDDQPVNLLCAPFLATLSGDAYREAAASLAEYCAKRGAFLIADPPADWKSVSDVVRDADGMAVSIGENGAIYWPPLKDAVLSEAVANVYVRTDETRGVWKPPSGIEATLDAVTPAIAINAATSGVLTRMNVNPIRTFSQYGTVVWGARTMSLDPDYRYVPVRRLMLYIEQSIVSLQEWSASQQNDESTWIATRGAVEEFLTSLWRQGALAGARADYAFAVRCDQTTMTQDDIDNGRLLVVVRVAPVSPAEFVVLRIGMWTTNHRDDDD
jgi:phage tail sheath protein FI